MIGNKKNVITNVLIASLVIINIATLATYWLRKDGPQPMPKNRVKTEAFIIKELNLDSAQQRKYLQLVKEHQDEVNEIRRTENIAGKEHFFDLLKQDSVTDNNFKAALLGTAKEQMQIDSLTFYHFKKLREMCNDEQRKKFDEIIQRVLKLNAPPPPPRPEQRKPNMPPSLHEQYDPPPPPQE